MLVSNTFVGAQRTVEVFRVLCCASLYQCCVQRIELVEVIRVVFMYRHTRHTALAVTIIIV